MVNTILFNSHIKRSLNKSLLNKGWTKPENSNIIVSPDGLYSISTSKYKGTVTVALKQVTETFDFKPVSTTKIFRRDGHAVFSNTHKTNPNLNTESDLRLASNVTAINVIENTDAIANYFIAEILSQNIKNHKVVSDLTKPFTRSAYCRCILDAVLNILMEQNYQMVESYPVTHKFTLEEPLTRNIVEIKLKTSSLISIELWYNKTVNISSESGVLYISQEDSERVETYQYNKSSNMDDLINTSNIVATRAVSMLGI